MNDDSNNNNQIQLKMNTSVNYMNAIVADRMELELRWIDDYLLNQSRLTQQDWMNYYHNQIAQFCQQNNVNYQYYTWLNSMFFDTIMKFNNLQTTYFKNLINYYEQVISETLANSSQYPFVDFKKLIWIRDSLIPYVRRNFQNYLLPLSNR